MGIEILSFTIKDVYDDVQYLASLGKAQTASVKRDADAGVAEANRDAGIREAECEKSAMDVKYSTDTKIEDNSRLYKLQKAHFDQEINTAVGSLTHYLFCFLFYLKSIYFVKLFAFIYSYFLSMVFGKLFVIDSITMCDD